MFAQIQMMENTWKSKEDCTQYILTEKAHERVPRQVCMEVYEIGASEKYEDDSKLQVGSSFGVKGMDIIWNGLTSEIFPKPIPFQFVNGYDA